MMNIGGKYRDKMTTMMFSKVNKIRKKSVCRDAISLYV